MFVGCITIILRVHTLIPALRFSWMNRVIIPEKRNTSGFHGVRLCACLLSLSSGAADGVSGRCSQRRGTCVVTSFDLFLLCASLWTQTCPSSQLYGEALAALHLGPLQTERGCWPTVSASCCSPPSAGHRPLWPRVAMQP